jgi:hypothetical protein
MTISINGSGTITGLSSGGLPDGSVTTAEIADSAITTAKIASAAITQAKLETLINPLGVGQTWQNVAASRAYGTTYTNTTGRPIFIFVMGTGYSSSSYATVAGVTAGGANTTSTSCNVWAVVPSGSTYSVSNSGASLLLWSELR